MRNIILLFILMFCLSTTQKIAAQTQPKDLVFQIEVNTDPVNQKIELTWHTLPNVTGYKIFRKLRNETQFTLLSTITDANVTMYTDNTVSTGVSYEYAVQSATTKNISGYVSAGIKIPAKHDQGLILLVIDNAYLVAAQTELEMFKRDLIKEGWKVTSIAVARTDHPSSVKQQIQTVCLANPNQLKGAILLGHVPVPYSGEIAPDAHSDHIGAWPSDVYYADMCTTQNSIWSDASLVRTTASDPRNHNIIGDQKFDISNFQSSASSKIFIGRVDVYDMPTINANDTLLFKQYLVKDHAYRAGLTTFKEQAIIDDNFGYFYGEAFAQNGWRNISALVGKNNVQAGDYFTDMKNDSYLWSYACGGGWYTGASGIGTTTSFKTNEVKSVFSMLYGSYFGDWDNTDNFLRAPIASPSATLVSCWVGRPNWYFHTMGMGEPIGYSYLNTINNSNTYYPLGFMNGQVHESLQGDPTLKMHVYQGVNAVYAQALENNQIKLEWDFSTDPEVVGYYVYKSNSIDGDFQLVTPNYITANSFIDQLPGQQKTASSMGVYMVRAVKLENTPTGSYYNLSPGAIVENFSNNSPLPVEIESFTGVTLSDKSNVLTWDVSAEANVLAYEIERGENAYSFSSLNVIQATNQKKYTTVDNAPKAENYYRLKITDRDGSSRYHAHIVYLKGIQNRLDNMTLYPNPATDDISLNIPNAEENAMFTYEILNLQGGFVRSDGRFLKQGLNQISIDIRELTAGIYFIRCRDDASNDQKILKFIKKD